MTSSPMTRTRTHARRRAVLATAVAGLALAATPAAARAAGGDATPTGGLSMPGTPTLSAATCAKQQPWTCARGQVLTLRGEDLAGARAIVFLGGRGPRDDVRLTVAARAARSGDLLTVVPARAKSGPLRIVSYVGAKVISPKPLKVLAELPATDDAGHLTKLIAGGRRSAVLQYRLTGEPPEGARVEAVRAGVGDVVRSWRLEPDGEVRWDGFVGDEPAPTGTYVLRLNDAADAVADVNAGSDSEFDLIEGFFPIRGRHTLASSPMQRFGGGRGHQGSDNFAACGTPLAALSKGVVHVVGSQSAAGNYVVVNLPNGESYVYMHLRDRALVNKGQKVFAGQRLGYVGDTGHAEGCHLHIELWTAPGWYQGGDAYDSLPLMKRLDRWS